MPTQKELLESLRDGFANLEYGDDDKLSRLKQRGLMILRRVYGEPSEPYDQLVNATFVRIFNPSVQDEFDETWDSDQREIMIMLEILIEEIDLEAAEQDHSEEEQYGRSNAKPKSNRVFVAHGHDDVMRESVARVLTKLGLEPVILHEQADRGRMIIEKFYEHSDVGFAVVLLSPDDAGYSNADGLEAARPRARQNVILELGFFLGKLGRENVVALHKGDVKIPSDFSGVLFKPYVPGGDWPYKLARELREQLQGVFRRPVAALVLVARYGCSGKIPPIASAVRRADAS